MLSEMNSKYRNHIHSALVLLTLLMLPTGAIANDYLCKHQALVGFTGIPESNLQPTEFNPREFGVDISNPDWFCLYPEGESFLYCGDYFSQFIMQTETLEFTITYHNGLFKDAQDNLYVGYGTCVPNVSVSADMIVG